MPDIDIDFADRKKVLDVIKHIPATIKENSTFKKHNTGVYCHSIPYNPVTNTASFDYKEADARGYLKIDFLNVGIYKDVTSEEQLIRLLNTEPLWDLLEQDDFANMLFHVNGHGTVLRQLKPKSIEELAAVLAVIRPAKRYLIGKDWATINAEVWQKPSDDNYYFKKSHAHSYAALVVIHMNMLCEKIANGEQLL